MLIPSCPARTTLTLGTDSHCSPFLAPLPPSLQLPAQLLCLIQALPTTTTIPSCSFWWVPSYKLLPNIIVRSSFLTWSSREKCIQISGSVESETKNAAEKAQEHQGHHVPSLRYSPKFEEQTPCKVKMSALCFLRKGIFIDKTHTNSAPQPKHELTSGTRVHMAHRILPSTHLCLLQRSCSRHSRQSLPEQSHLSPSTEKGAANCNFTGRRV